MKEIKVTAIKEGTVLDHIPSKRGFKIAEILALEACLLETTGSFPFHEGNHFPPHRGQSTDETHC